jgi:putative FmdB family regulatory protein
MPIYEYRCGACGHEHEALQKVSEPPLTKCPACGKPKLQKLLSAAGFQLKGSGWYATDFKNKAADKKTDTKKPEAKTETKADPKPTPAATD